MTFPLWRLHPLCCRAAWVSEWKDMSAGEHAADKPALCSCPQLSCQRNGNKRHFVLVSHFRHLRRRSRRSETSSQNTVIPMQKILHQLSCSQDAEVGGGVPVMQSTQASQHMQALKLQNENPAHAWRQIRLAASHLSQILGQHVLHLAIGGDGRQDPVEAQQVLLPD